MPLKGWRSRGPGNQKTAHGLRVAGLGPEDMLCSFRQCELRLQMKALLKMTSLFMAQTTGQNKK